MNFVFSYMYYLFQLVLTPSERWSGARRFDSGSGDSQQFVILAIAALIFLRVLLLFVSLYRKYQEKKTTGSLFFNNSIERGLTEREQLILGEVAVKAGLKQKSSIFTIS